MAELRSGVRGKTESQLRGDVSRWHEVAAGQRGVRNPVWRAYCDGLHEDLIATWLRPARAGLKTDLFDEAVGRGLVGALESLWDEVHGVDIAASVVAAACDRHPSLRGVVADVRALPYAPRSFEAVLSNSTLDHFDEAEDIRISLSEFRRVLMPGGRLLVTLDNLANPLVQLRSALPPRVLRRTGLVPFPVGITLTRAGLVAFVESSGFRVDGSGVFMHAPRAPAVWTSDLVRRSEAGGRHVVRILRSAERLSRLRTRERTGYYVVVSASRTGR